MKILREGTIPEPQPPWWVGLTIECLRCGATFQLEDDDAVITMTERHPNGRSIATINCPTCGNPATRERPRWTPPLPNPRLRDVR